jgi:hypothetical protein
MLLSNNTNGRRFAEFAMGNKTAPQKLDQSVNTEGRADQRPSAAIDEIRQILLGDALRDCQARLAEAEALIERLGRNLDDKFADLHETPWDDLRTSLSALWYRFDILDRRFGELDAAVRDRLVNAASTFDTANALDERLRAIERKLWGDG